MSRIALVSTLVAALGAAAEPQTLQQFLDAAETKNVDGRILAEQRVRAQAEFRQTWLSLLPSLTVSAGWTNNQYEAAATIPTGATTPPAKLVIVPQNQFDAVFRVDLPLVNVPLWFRTLASEQAAAAASEKERAGKDGVRLGVVQAFYTYAAAIKVHDAAARSAQVAQAQLELIQARNEAGAATELDVLRARAEVQRTKQLVADTDTAIAITARLLGTLSGLEATRDVSAPAPDPTEAHQPTEQLVGRIDQLPQVRAAQGDVATLGKLATAQTLALVPLLNAQFTERVTNATGFAGKEASYNAGINLSWRLDAPTFQAMEVQRINERTAQLAVERAQNTARDAIVNAAQRLDAAQLKVGAAKAQLEAARRAAQVAQDRYSVGAATQVEVIQAERDLFGADVNEITALTELASARAVLLLSAGLPLADK